MSQQYLRKVSLKVRGASSVTANSFDTSGDTDEGDAVVTAGQTYDLSELRIKFNVKRRTVNTPNSMFARVYNLSAQTAKAILRCNEFGSVQLQVAYGDINLATIFAGTILQVRLGRESPTDTYTDIVAAEGDIAWNQAVLSETLGAGSVTPSAQIGIIDKSLQKVDSTIMAGDTPSNLPTNALPRGKTFWGMTRDLVRDIQTSMNGQVSIDANQRNFVLNSAAVDGDTIIINKTSGMVGLPEQTENGVRVRCLLNPKIRLGSKIQLNNGSVQLALLPIGPGAGLAPSNFPSIGAAADGVYKVLYYQHVGDTRGNEWYTDMITYLASGPLPAGAVQSGFATSDDTLPQKGYG